MSDMNKVFDELNDEQKEAAAHIFGPCYVIAGPGSGKTKVLVRKIAYAIQNGINPKNILVFTFTRKAANEIKERVNEYVGSAADGIIIGTYHSVCVRILRQYAHYLGYSNYFTILDKADSENILSKLCKKTDLNAKSISSYISQQKRHMIDYETAVKEAIGIDEKRAGIYRDYEVLLKSQNSMDFDNLIFNTVLLLYNFSDIRSALHERYQFVYCDETQDSSNCDLSFISLIINEQQNVTIFLDDDQSIYGFRGADVKSVISFKDALQDAKLFTLNRNYRSSQSIVNASSSLINKNVDKLQKNLFSNNDIGDKIIYAEENSPKAEAMRICSFIHLMTSEKYNLSYKDIAILYRVNGFVTELERVLLSNNIPYETVGHVDFYNKREIKDVIAFLKFLVNPYNLEAFKRIINIPKRGIGEATIEKIVKYCLDNCLDFYEGCKQYASNHATKKLATNLESFINILDTLINVYCFSTPTEALSYILEAIQYQEHIKSFNDKEQNVLAMRFKNIEVLMEISVKYATIQELIDNSALDNVEEENSDNKVTLMTIHASKGLEYPCVIIGGCNEECIPFIKAIEENNIEEERRLFYVAMTRAKRFLFLTRSKVSIFGNHYKTTKESRFIKEIDPNYLFRMNAK